MDPSSTVLFGMAVALQAFLYLLFGRYVEPRWRMLPLVACYFLITWILANSFGWWSLLWIVGHPALGLFAHASWCRNHGIDWRTCEPRERYLELLPWGIGEDIRSGIANELGAAEPVVAKRSHQP